MNLDRGSALTRPLIVPALLLAALCGTFLGAEPEDGPARHERARGLLLSGQAEEAAASYAALLQAAPTDVEAAVGRVRALLAQQRARQALREARGFHEDLPGDARLVTALAEALFRSGRLEEVGPLLEDWVDAPDAPARALATLGRLRDAEGRWAEAVTLMDRALAADPEDREVLYWSAGATTGRGVAVDRLERYLERSEGDDPDRIEGARGNIRTLNMLGERAIWVSAERPERLELPLSMIWDPSSGETVGYAVKVQLGDKRKAVPLLLDSGSPGLAVAQRIARKRGFLELAQRTAFGGGGDRKHVTTRGLFPAVSLGGLTFNDALASSVPGEIDPLGRFHGYIGLSVFNGYKVTLDLAGKRLVAEAPADTPRGDPYWSLEGQMLVRAAVGQEPALLLLDTGATRTLVDTGLAARLDGASLRGTPTISGHGGMLEGARILDGVVVVFQGLTGGPRWASDLSVRSRLGGVEVGGFLGLDLLAGARIEVDTIHRRVRAIPPASRRR